MAARELTISSWVLIQSVHSEMVLSSQLHVLLLNKSTEKTWFHIAIVSSS